MLPLPFTLENDSQNVAQKQLANEKCRLWEGQFKPIMIIVRDTSLGLESPQIFWSFPKKLSEVKVAQSCLTLCNPMGYSPPGSSVHEIFQARVLEWVAIPFSRGSSWPRDWIWISGIAGRYFTSWATRGLPPAGCSLGQICYCALLPQEGIEQADKACTPCCV